MTEPLEPRDPLVERVINECAAERLAEAIRAYFLGELKKSMVVRRAELMDVVREVMGAEYVERLESDRTEAALERTR